MAWGFSVEAALPLRLASLKASHYLVFRYSLVRSGAQKAALQEELDRGMSRDYAELASCWHLAVVSLGPPWRLDLHLLRHRSYTRSSSWMPGTSRSIFD